MNDDDIEIYAKQRSVRDLMTGKYLKVFL